MNLIKNASPEVTLLGTDDKSIRSLKPEPVPLPQHLPLFFMFAEKGTSKRFLTGGAAAVVQYGAQSFDKNFKWFNHQTRFLSAVLGTGNACLVQRVIPDDAGVRASACLYVDILETMVPNYKRNSFGNYFFDPITNAYAVDTDTPEIPGYKIKFIKENHTIETELGLLTTKTGTMMDGNTVSTMYPILELQAKEKGAYYNNLGFSISSVNCSDIDKKILNTTKGLYYKLSLHTKDSENSSPVVFRNLYGEPSTNFSLNYKVINPNTEARFDLEYVFNTLFFNEKDELKPLKYRDYENVHVYRSQLEIVLGMILNKEKDHISNTPQLWQDDIYTTTASWFDFTTTDQTKILEEKYLINLFSLKSSKDIKYFTVMHSEDPVQLTGTQREVSISSTTPIFMSGGSDGSLTPEMFETVIRRELSKYSDPDSEVIDTAINVESIMYDSGFGIDTKKDMVNFIALRKDTNIVLSTHVDELGEKSLPLSDARAIGVALKTRLNLAPESEFFGTSVARALVVVGTGKPRDGSTLNEVPLSYDLAIKASKMMGAANGKWKKEYLFDKAPNSIITSLTDIKPGFIPAGIKPTLWNDGLVWAQPIDRQQFYFPALQTVYADDTSVLNSFFTIQAICTITKIGADAWRNFTGSISLTNGEFIDAVTNYVKERLKDKFADVVVVMPDVVISEEDELRGYSWQLFNRLYANNMKTRMIYVSESYRMSDLTTAN